MLVSPADPNNGGTDWVAIFTDLANFLLDVKGLPSIPNFSNGIVPVPSGTGADTSSVWGIWKNPWGSGWHVTAKGINFRYQPNFPNPDVYTIDVHSQAEMWIAAPEGSIIDTTISLSNSFQYVYESDANSGNDAGKDFSTATGIALGSYNGLGYGTDTVDMYKFDGYAGQTIYYNLLSASSADFGVSFYDPSWNPLSGAGGDPGAGGYLYRSFTPSTTGSFYEKIYLTSGSGSYSFALSTSPIPPDFSVSPYYSSMCEYPGASTGDPYTIASLNSFSGNVALSLAFTPSSSYVTYEFIQTGGPTETVSISPSSSAFVGTYVQSVAYSTSEGSYTMTVTGTSGPITHSASVPWTISYNCPAPSGGGGGGGGSVASGSLITLADGGRIPVQMVRTGDRVVVYNVPTGNQTIAVVDQIQKITVNSTLTIYTSAGGAPFRADANPRMKLWVLSPLGPVEKPITTIQQGDQIYNYDASAWVQVTDITITYGGLHSMYDLSITPDFTSNGLLLEYIANGYPDCYRACKM